MQPEFFDVALVIDDISPYAETESADDNEKGDGKRDDGIGSVMGKRDKRFFAEHPAHQVESGVAECRNRVPDGIIDAFSHSEIGNEADREENSAQAFKNSGSDKDAPYQAANTAQPSLSRGLHESLAFVKPHMSAQQIKQDGYEGHKSQSAGLDKYNNDDLPEKAPVRVGVVGDKPRHARRGCGGEQSVDVSGGLSVFRRKRQK